MLTIPLASEGAGIGHGVLAMHGGTGSGGEQEIPLGAMIFGSDLEDPPLGKMGAGPGLDSHRVDVDSESDDGLGLGPGPVERGGDTCRSGTFETSAADKENDAGVPRRPPLEAADEKVSTASFMCTSTQCAQPFAHLTCPSSDWLRAHLQGSKAALRQRLETIYPEGTGGGAALHPKMAGQRR